MKNCSIASLKYRDIKAWYIALCALCFSLTSCNHDTYSIQLLTPNATGVIPKTPVKIRGMQIGEVKYLNLYSNKYILITLKIDGKFKLPKKSEFIIEPSDFVGNKYISVKTVETGNEYLKEADTIYESKDTRGVQNFGEGEISADSLVKAIQIEKEKVKENISK